MVPQSPASSAAPEAVVVPPPTSTTSPDPAPATGARSETSAQLTAILRKAGSSLPTALLVEHLQLHYADAGFVVLRAAAEAVARRLQIAGEERLRVLRRPAAGPFGAYQTARRGRQQRPYRTALWALSPLHASCDCADFRASSLGVCKHLLAVLADLARRPRAWGRTMRHPAMARPALRWHPFKPMLGSGDWLAQVEATCTRGAMGGGRVATALRRRFVRRADGLGELRTTHADDATARLGLVDELQRAVETAREAGDPALLANLEEERRRLQESLALRPLAVRGAGVWRGFRRRLYPYQRTGVAQFLARGRLLLADDMGLGKTTQAIAACFRLFEAGMVQRGLLVVPAPLKQQWLREWQACCTLPIQVVDGSPPERARAYRAMRRGFLLVNYEQLLRDIELAKAWRPEFVLLDEAQRIKNWQTRTAAVVKQLEPRFRLVLTGTPFENRVLDLDSILEWIDRRPLQPQWRLMPFHQIDGGAGLRHLDTLRARLEPVLVRRRRQEVLDQLPGRTDTRIDVALTAPQRDEHDALLQPIARLLQAAERRPLTQAEFLRLMALFTEQRILANGLAQRDFDGVWPGIARTRPEPALLEGLSMPKLVELRALLQQIVVDQQRKIVVFSQWRRALQLAAWAVEPLLASAGVRCAFFTGAESQRRRNEGLVAFHDDPAVRVLFATDAGGVGLNLQHAASCCLHFDLPWNPAVFEQRVGRIWRLGQTDKVDVYSLVSEDCIESRMAVVLQNKQAAFSALFDGQNDEVRFEQQGGFLAAARRIVGASIEAANAAARGAVEDEARESMTDDESELGAPAAAGAGQPVAGAAAAADDERERPSAAPIAVDPARVRSLLRGLAVQPRADGGLVLEADREAAGVLAEVLRGLATAIEGAAKAQPCVGP